MQQARPRSSVDRAVDFESTRGGSIPPGAILSEAARCDTGAVIELREVVEADLSVFFEYQRDPESNAMAAVAPRETDAFLEHWRTRVLGDSATKVQTILESGNVAGSVLSWAAPPNRFVGYWLGRDFWGRGIATAALELFLRDHDRERPLAATVAVHNVASMRVLETCGFARMGAIIPEADGVDVLRFRLEAE